jgi:hypothetical protein
MKRNDHWAIHSRLGIELVAPQPVVSFPQQGFSPSDDGDQGIRRRKACCRQNGSGCGFAENKDNELFHKLIGFSR